MRATLTIVLALALGALALVGARRRAVRRPLAGAVDPDAPLAPGELRRLTRWRARLRRVLFALGFAYLFLVGTALLGLEPPPGRAATALGLLGAACLLAVAVQFSERCPRCGFNLGFQPTLVLPEACSRCGGRYR